MTSPKDDFADIRTQAMKARAAANSDGYAPVYEVTADDLERLLAAIDERDAEIARLRKVNEDLVKQVADSNMAAAMYVDEIDALESEVERLRPCLCGDCR
jgi:hypothetical protein